MKQTKIGVFIAIIMSGLIILSVEQHYSFSQILIGFLIYIFPSIFISYLKSGLFVFFISILTILFVYFSFHFEYYHTWIGVLIAFSIGLPIHFYRISKAKVI